MSFMEISYTWLYLQLGNEQYYILVIFILVNLPETPLGGFCLTCQTQSMSGRKFLYSTECDANAYGYCGRNIVPFVQSPSIFYSIQFKGAWSRISFVYNALLRYFQTAIEMFKFYLKLGMKNVQFEYVVWSLNSNLVLKQM